MVPDGSGGTFITWQDAGASGSFIHALRIDSSGQPPAGWPTCGVRVCTATGYQQGGSAVTDGHGGVIIFWTDYRASPAKVFAQRVNGDGALLWNVDGVRACTADSAQIFDTAMPDGRGGAIVLWEDLRRAPPPEPPRYRSHYDLYSQRIDASGVPAWDPRGVPVCADSGERVLAGNNCLASDGAGGAVIVFVDDGRVGFYAQHLDASGSRLWNDDGSLIPTIGGATDVVTDGAGGVWVATSDGRNGAYNVWVEHLDALGNIVSAPGGILVSNATNEQAIGDRFNSAASDGADGVIVTWVDTRNGLDRDVFAQRVLASGTVDPRWTPNGAHVCTAPGIQINPAIVADGYGGAIITWYDQRSVSSYDIYAQHVTATGAIAPGWAQNGVALCTAPGEQVYPDVVTDGAGGAIAYWDDYRGSGVDIYAQHVSSGGMVGAVTTGVDLLSPSAMILEAPFPNPASRALLVSFAVPSSEPVHVALFDILGREIQSLALGSLGPGRHFVHLPGVAVMNPGVYVVRLTQGNRSLSRHFAVVR